MPKLLSITHTFLFLFYNQIELKLFSKIKRDGVIEATLDHENGWLISNQMIDVYSTEEPQKAFHRYFVKIFYKQYFFYDFLNSKYPGE